MKVHCRTNLDLFNESWPMQLPAVPNVGDHIESSTVRNHFRLTLQVKSIEYKADSNGVWYPEIELHMSDRYHRHFDKGWSIVDFYDWYAPKVGKTTSCFI